MRRTVVALLALCAVATPAHAQLVVIDPGNLEQTRLIAERTLQAYRTLVAQYETLVQMAHGLGNMDRYRVPPASITRRHRRRTPCGR